VIRRIVVQSLGKLFARPYLKKPFTKKRAGRVAQGEGPEFKDQYYAKEKKKKKFGFSQNLIT
jgi:hypothetical protein